MWLALDSLWTELIYTIKKMYSKDLKNENPPPSQFLVGQLGRSARSSGAR